MAAKSILGFEEKYLSKHFKSEYVAYRNNCFEKQRLDRLIPVGMFNYRTPQKPQQHLHSYRDLGKVEGSTCTLEQILEKCDGFEPANVTISVSKDYDNSIESYDLELTVFGPNPKYEAELVTYEAAMAEIEVNKAKLAVVEKRLLELSDIFDAALAKLL